MALYLATHAIGAYTGWKVLADAEAPEAPEQADEDEDEDAEAEADDESKSTPKIRTVKTQPDARLTRITRFNVFCPTCVPADAVPLPEDGVAPGPVGVDELEFPGAVRSQLPLALLATMEATPPGISLATIMQQNAATGVYAEGDEIMDQVTLLAVDLGIVYLRTATRVEYLQVSSDDPPPVPKAAVEDDDKAPPKKSKNELDGASDAISCQGLSCTVKREFVSQLLANPGMLLSQGNARPYARDDLKGFRLSRVRKGTVPNMLGLRSGDVLTGINGQPLDSMDGAMKLYARLRNASHLTVDLTRNKGGQRLELRLDISII